MTAPLTFAQTAAPKKPFPDASTSPLSIEAMRARSYPGSALTVRQTLRAGSGYSRQVVSYRSNGLTINALLTVPNGTPPRGGWPAIVFNHGYIPPNEYRTTERYVAYQDASGRPGPGRGRRACVWHRGSGPLCWQWPRSCSTGPCTR